MTRVKVCGLTRIEDVELAVELGASAVGFVLEPSSPRCVGLAEIGELLAAVPPYVARTAVMGPFQSGFHLASFDAVQAIGVRRSMLEASQRAVCTVRVGSDDDLPAAEDADAIHLDAYSPDGYGGTGKDLDLAAAKGVMADSVRPVIVSGGLNPSNVHKAIAELRPYAVDVSSGIESEPGVKDPALLREFFEAVRRSDARLL